MCACAARSLPARLAPRRISNLEEAAGASEAAATAAQTAMQRATMRAEMLGAENDQLAEQLAAFKRAARQEIMRSGGSPSSCVGGAPTAVATVPVLQPHPNYELEPEPEPEPLLAAAGDDMAVSSGGAVEDWRVTGDRLQPLHSLPYEGPLKKDGTPDKRTKAYKQWQEQENVRAAEDMRVPWDEARRQRQQQKDDEATVDDSC